MPYSQFKKAVDSGRLTCHKHHFTAKDRFILIGQPGQEKNMDTLAQWTQAYTDPEKFRALAASGAPSEGTLPGYSDKDIALWIGGLQQMNPVMRFLMMQTQDLRRWARQELMKQDGGHWKRNGPS